LRMLFVQLRIAPQNPKTPWRMKLINLNSSLLRMLKNSNGFLSARQSVQVNRLE